MSEHQPVLLQECLDALAIKPNGIYIDGTFGRGGHSQAILAKLGEEGRLIAFDKDSEAIACAKEQFNHDSRFSIIHDSFTAIKSICDEQGLTGLINGILLDLGVSSPQLDDASRGFSFMQDGPLDMRMNHERGMSAADFIQDTEQDEMADVFYQYGEERYSRRIAAAIVKARQEKKIKTTIELAEIVKKAHPKWEKHKHPATRVFQAIRIFINQELSDLTAVLEQAVDVLAPAGRLAVISFHSLEDRIVKQFMRHKEQGDVIPAGVPIRHQEMPCHFKRVGKKIKASQEELGRNIRARSAVLRVGEKQS